MDIALTLEGSGETLPEVMLRHKITVDDLGRFNSDPIFLQKVGFLREEVRTKGMTFRLILDTPPKRLKLPVQTVVILLAVSDGIRH
jgi:hypothetical protein